MCSGIVGAVRVAEGSAVPSELFLLWPRSDRRTDDLVRWCCCPMPPWSVGTP